mmetsp:Transcript_124588/g.360320  ORF Transcript_124588/g.360320 Transcript_124588/m.360320 type:complete len:608 (-) Transcript_124588:165-1988(-)
MARLRCLPRSAGLVTLGLGLKASGVGAGPRDIVDDRAWSQFKLLTYLRAEGYTCPGGRHFEPIATRLQFDCRLWEAAQLHSQAMADAPRFSETAGDGQTAQARAKAIGVEADSETVAAGMESAGQTLRHMQWSLQSCATMLDPKARYFAVADVYSQRSQFHYYWTQLFRAGSDEGAEDIDRSCYPEDPDEWIVTTPPTTEAPSTSPSTMSTTVVDESTTAVAAPAPQEDFPDEVWVRGSATFRYVRGDLVNEKEGNAFEIWAAALSSAVLGAVAQIAGVIEDDTKVSMEMVRRLSERPDRWQSSPMLRFDFAIRAMETWALDVVYLFRDLPVEELNDIVNARLAEHPLGVKGLRLEVVSVAVEPLDGDAAAVVQAQGDVPVPALVSIGVGGALLLGGVCSCGMLFFWHRRLQARVRRYLEETDQGRRAPPPALDIESVVRDAGAHGKGLPTLMARRTPPGADRNKHKIEEALGSPKTARLGSLTARSAPASTFRGPTPRRPTPRDVPRCSLQDIVQDSHWTSSGTLHGDIHADTGLQDSQWTSLGTLGQSEADTLHGDIPAEAGLQDLPQEDGSNTRRASRWQEKLSRLRQPDGDSGAAEHSERGPR